MLFSGFSRLPAFVSVCVYCCVFLLVGSAVSVEAGVVYQFVGVDGGVTASGLAAGEVWGTLEFDPATSNASATSDWTAPAGNLSALLEGGISGFWWDFGSGLEQATGGDMDYTQEDVPFQSSSGGLYLSGGAYGSEGCPEGMNCDVEFPSGQAWYIFGDNDYYPSNGNDAVEWYAGGQGGHAEGHWVLASSGQPIPEPTTLSLLGLASAGLLRRRRA